jgi:hypothetical protein
MSRIRFSIASLLAVVLVLALAFAALRNPNRFWASATFTLAILAVSVAVVVAVARKGQARLTWLGFAVFGWASLLIWLSTSETIDHSMNGPPVPVMTWGLRSLELHINQKVPIGRANSMDYLQVCHSLEVILVGFVGAILGRFVAVEDDRPDPLRA